MFPKNRVEYFVSYYDYYQPEAYLPTTDTYIEKDSSINDEIDRLRHSATSALLTRRDVIIVASVSAIYGLGSPEQYGKQLLMLERGRRARSARRSCAGSSSCSTSATTSASPATSSACGATRSRCSPRTRSRRSASSSSATRSSASCSVDPLTGEIVEELDGARAVPRVALRHRRGAPRGGDRGHRGRARRAAGRARGARQAARSATPAHAHELRPRDAARGRELLGRRELLDAPRRPAAAPAALHAARLLPRRLAVHRRRVARQRSRSCTASSRATARARTRSSSTGSACRPRWTTGRCASRSSPSASTRSCSCRPRRARTSARRRRRSSSRSCARPA